MNSPCSGDSKPNLILKNQQKPVAKKSYDRVGTSCSPSRVGVMSHRVLLLVRSKLVEFLSV